MRNLLALLFVLGACASSPTPEPNRNLRQGDGNASLNADATSIEASPEASTCGGPGAIRFDRAHACDNDDSVEFCLDPSANSRTESERIAAVLAVAPAATCRTGSAGRAGCTGVPLCMIPIDPSSCVGSELDEEEWKRLCTLAELPFVGQIVPTFYE